MNQPILVTGGYGFVGSNFIISHLAERGSPIVNLDCLSYAASIQNLNGVKDHLQLHCVIGNICDNQIVQDILHQFEPRAIIHFAAETHVDRSLESPNNFVQTNVAGTLSLLQATLDYWNGLSSSQKGLFRFLHVSTDEVYGSLGCTQLPFLETSAYRPNSPYSASKAAADHLIRAYWKSYGLPILIVHSSNIYGPRQFPEKLIPLLITNCIAGNKLPIYGDGLQSRDWLYVEDCCRAISIVLSSGRVGENYNVGTGIETTNLELARAICNIMDELMPGISSNSSRITFVKDRLGHDRRYLMDCTKIRQELGWKPHEMLTTGVHRTIEWYLNNPEWMRNITEGSYKTWIEKHYGAGFVHG